MLRKAIRLEVIALGLVRKAKLPQRLQSRVKVLKSRTSASGTWGKAKYKRRGIFSAAG